MFVFLVVFLLCLDFEIFFGWVCVYSPYHNGLFVFFFEGEVVTKSS